MKLSSRVLIVIAMFSFDVKSAPPAAVQVDEVAEKALAPRLWVSGSIASREDSKIATELAGVLEYVSEAGSVLKKGEPVAKVNTDKLTLQLRRDRAAIEKLKSQLEFAEQQLSRAKNLSKTNSTTQFRVDELAMQRDVLTQDLELANIQLDHTQYFINRARILAPFSGVVVSRFHQPGEHIASGEALIRLVNLDTLEVRANAPIDSSHYLEVGHTVLLKKGEQHMRVPLSAVIPVGDAVSRMFEVRATLAESLSKKSGRTINRWRVGDAVLLGLQNGEASKRLTVPRDALVLRGREVFVYKVGRGDTAETLVARKIRVITGVSDESRIAVEGDLKPSDRVVIRGAERLQDGQGLVIVEALAQQR